MTAETAAAHQRDYSLVGADTIRAQELGLAAGASFLLPHFDHGKK